MTATAVAPVAKPSLVSKFATKFGVEPEKMLTTLKATAFKQQGDNVITNEQMMALMIVADQYGLNPFTKEVFAFPDKRNGIVPVVSVDGWARIVNEQPNCDGIEFIDGPPAGPLGIPEWIECVIYRKDRSHPVKVRERFSEVRRDTQPWQSHPARMMRHKAFIQCARLAFGFAGIYDEDEAERVREAVDVTPPPEEPKKVETKTAAVVDRIRARKPIEVPAEAAAEAPVEAPIEAPIETPIETPVAMTYKRAEYIIGNTTDEGIATECLDLARSSLNKPDYAKLVGIWNAKFATPVEED